MTEKYAELIDKVRATSPLVHHITNYVTVNDCANITLGIGASPIMADAIDEAADIAAISSAVVLNMGTLNERTIPSMLAAGKSANEKGVPVVIDPVGAGASQLRNETVAEQLKEIRPAVVRGNISEIRFLAGLTAETKGVDAADGDKLAGDEAMAVARDLALKLGCVVAITAAVDVVSDGGRTVLIENGHEKLSGLTGTGCMCSSLIGSYCGANPELPLESTVAALLSMGIAGEIAFANSGDKGNGSFRVSLHDAISRMDAATIEKYARVREA